MLLRVAVEATFKALPGDSDATPRDVVPLKNCTLPEGSPSTRPAAPITMKWKGPPVGGGASATVAVLKHSEMIPETAQTADIVVVEFACVICWASDTGGASAAEETAA